MPSSDSFVSTQPRYGVEYRYEHSGYVDLDKLIAAFSEEWAEFLGGDTEFDEDDKLEFAKESAGIMGKDFLDGEWFDEDASAFDEIYVSRRRR